MLKLIDATRRHTALSSFAEAVACQLFGTMTLAAAALTYNDTHYEHTVYGKCTSTSYAPWNRCWTNAFIETVINGIERYLECHYPALFDGLVQDCSNSIALAIELPKSCAKPSIFSTFRVYKVKVFIKCYSKVFIKTLCVYRVCSMSWKLLMYIHVTYWRLEMADSYLVWYSSIETKRAVRIICGARKYDYSVTHYSSSWIFHLLRTYTYIMFKYSFISITENPSRLFFLVSLPEMKMFITTLPGKLILPLPNHLRNQGH